MSVSLFEVKKMLRLRMNGVVSTAMRKSGLEYKLNYGLDAKNLRDVASKIEHSQELADVLWHESSRECKILATLVHPAEAYTQAKADEWALDCIYPELTEQLCFNLLQQVSFASETATRWIISDNTKLREAGYTLALRLMLKKKELTDKEVLIKAAQTDSEAENYQLRLTATRFLERATFTSDPLV